MGTGQKFTCSSCLCVQSYLDKLLKGEGGKIGHTNDVYGNVLMGNLHLSSAPSEVRGKGANKKELKQKQLQVRSRCSAHKMLLLA